MDNIARLAINELLLTSSDSSDDEMEIIATVVYRPFNERRPHIKDYVVSVVERYSEEEFRSHFRLKRDTIMYIHNLIKDKLQNKSHVGRPSVSSMEQLLSAIWYLATPESYRSMCDRFNIGKGTGVRNVRKVSDALFQLAPLFIKWPNDAEKEEISHHFNRTNKFPNIIGAIDGTYIKIPMPKENGRSYICRKNFAAITLQAICDHRMLFTHCYVGETASVHDASVLRRSEVWNYITERSDSMFPGNYSILGDKAYPCLKQLLVPYKEGLQLNEQKRLYNYRHASCRSIIERAFAILKGRFRILKFLDMHRIDWIPKIVIACCVLHNICIMQDDLLQEEFLDIHDFENEHDIPGIQLTDEGRRREGIMYRDQVCNGLVP